MANKIYQIAEAIVSWRSTGFNDFTCTSLASGAGRQGIQVDFGVVARARRFAWRAFLYPGATRVVGEPVIIKWKSSDGSRADNDDGTGDIAVSHEDKLRNVPTIGVIQIDEDAAVVMVASGEFNMPHRLGHPIFWNATANSLSADPTEFGFDVWPLADEIQ